MYSTLFFWKAILNEHKILFLFKYKTHYLINMQI